MTSILSHKGPAQALRESEERYRFLSEIIPVQIWTSLPSGQLDYVSQQTADYFGLTRAQLLADGWQNVVHPEDLPLVVARWTNALASANPYEVEFRLKAKSGDYLWHLGRAVPQRDATGAIVRWFGTNTNIEERRAQQRHVEALVAELREKNSLSTFSAEIGSMLVSPKPIEVRLQGCAELIVTHLDASFARIWTTDSSYAVLELNANAGLYADATANENQASVAQFEIDKIAAEREPYCTNRLLHGPASSDREWAAREGLTSFAGYPILNGQVLIGVAAMFARHPFSDAATAALGSFADALALALQRSRAEEKLRQSELWLSTTLSSIGDGVIATDPLGNVTFMNAVAASLTGWTSGEAIGQPLHDVFPIVDEQSRAVVESPVAKVLREGVVVGLANRTILLSRGGNELPIDDSAAPIRDGQGALIGVVLVFRNAAEKRHAEAERAHLLAQTQRAYRDAETARDDLHSLFMQAPAPICILRGPAHAFALANPAYMQLVGAERALIGRPFREALPELEGQGFYELLDRVYETGERFVGQDLPAKLDRRGQGTREDAFVTVVYEAFRGLDGEVAGILVIAFDMTDQVRARQSLEALLVERSEILALAEEARDRANVANRAKDEFLTTASHELRTPLNAILGWARLIRDGMLDRNSVTRGLAVIERNAIAQVQLIEDILDGSRLFTGKLHLEVASIDLAVVVGAAVDTVRPAATAKNIALVLDLDGESSRIHGDADRLQQIVWNLLNNALKFTPKGGRVEIRLGRVGTSTELRVSDNGCGITSDFLPHVFERFRQADGSITRRAGGLGLGLALVRHLVEAHGGTVQAKSAGEGLGASFTVTLPVQAVFPELPDTVRPLASQRVNPVPAATKPLSGITVLAVDDEADARELVSVLLQLQGAEVLLAASADGALQLLEDHLPDVMISDIGMPGRDGYSLMRSVRARRSEVSRLPAIALTAYARQEDRRRALEAGFDAYVSKPVEPRTLVQLVHDLAKPS